MARLRDEESVDRDEHSTIARSSSRRRRSTLVRTATSASPSPSVASDISDKENRSHNREKPTDMGPPPRPSAHARPLGAHANKRRRTGDGPTDTHTVADGSGEETTAAGPRSTEDPVYDPSQDIEERQKIRRGLRSLARDVKDLGPSEWMQAESDGLRKAIVAQNELYRQVKQTSDATIDSRSLLDTAILASKKTKKAAVGDGSQGVDVDDFISKCIVFMRKGDELEIQSGRADPQISSTQRRRRTQMDMDADDDEVANDGDAHNWAWLGSRACYQVNKRPCVPAFLLGPLSVQKRARAVTQRRARQQRLDPEQAVKPRELDAAAFQQQENSGVTHMCKTIHKRMWELYDEAGRVEEEGDEDELDAVVERNGVLDNGGISLFRFAINPHSFGQTVENLFYVSFLIKDGLAGIAFDSEGIPALMPQEVPSDDHEGDAAAAARNAQRFQAVIGLDFDDWKSIVRIFNIEQPLIGHREDDGASGGVGATGWYAS